MVSLCLLLRLRDGRQIFVKTVTDKNITLFGHKDGPKQGATSCIQGGEAWEPWRIGTYGDICLSDGVTEYAKTQEENKGAPLTFQKHAYQIYPGWKEHFRHMGESSVQAAPLDWQKKAAATAVVGDAPHRGQSAVVRRALDEPSRYADPPLQEDGLHRNGKHVLVKYIMEPMAGYDGHATAAHCAAESSTGTGVNICTADGFTEAVNTLAYYVDPETEGMKIAALFDHDIADDRAMMSSVVTLSIGNYQSMGDVEYGKINDIYFKPEYLRLSGGPSCSVIGGSHKT